MRDVYIVGVNTLKFDKYPQETIKTLAQKTVQGVLADANAELRDIQAVWFANASWGMASYQHCIRGQVALRGMGLDTVPITNVENACAGGSTAFHGAYKDVAGGFVDIALAVGAEKVYRANKYALFAGFLSGTDVETIVEESKRMLAEAAATPATEESASPKKKSTKKRKTLRDRASDIRDQAVVGIELGEAIGYDRLKQLLAVMKGGNKGDHSPFMDIYAYKAREHMKKYGSTARQLAVIASKNHYHSSMNPNAQYTFTLTAEEVLADRVVAPPLTRAMCAPVGDGAASAILMSEAEVLRRGLMNRAIKIRASILGSGRERTDDDPDIGERLAKLAYAAAGVGPNDIHCVEVHDATAFGELHQTEALGFFPKGEGGIHAERGETTLGGKIPVNPSGGLLSRGHPIGASGLAQIHELTTQLRGEAGARQVKGARIAMAENGGGALGKEEAAMCIHILERAGAGRS